ncbi:MAG: hypothetical protein ABI629_05070 [bacterium]
MVRRSPAEAALVIIALTAAGLAWLDAGDWLGAVPTALAALTVPLACGALLGAAIRGVWGRRRGVWAACAMFLGPLAALTLLTLRVPLFGLWDGLLEGALLGCGVLWAAHRAFVDGAGLALAIGSLLISLTLLEAACRILLPAAPAFPSRSGAHFWLADAMRAGQENHSWDLRSKEIVCSVLYEGGYTGLLDARAESDVLLPQQFRPRAGAARRVLHLGDSMTFGFGVGRDETFTAGLQRLEPQTQHINGAIPGIAPDAYYVVMRQWLARQPIDMVVMYVFEGNDLDGLDDHYPCCHWQSLLTYDPGLALRCPQAPRLDVGEAGPTWLRYNSPPPYLLRVLIPYSAAAAHLGAAIVHQMSSQPLAVHQERQTQFTHLTAVLGAARDAAQARGVAFIVVVLPTREWVENPRSDRHLAPQIVAVARQLGVPVLDASDAVAAAAGRGESLFLPPPDPHFSVAGHAVIGRWLHQALAPLVDPAAADGAPDTGAAAEIPPR